MTAVSVVIVNYCAGDSLRRSVASALPFADEVIVVDNASTDGSVDDLLRRFGHNPAVRLLTNARNEGFSAACNRGALESSGDFLLFLNPDAELEVGALPRLVSVMRSDPLAGMAGGLLLNPDGSEQRGGRRLTPSTWGSAIEAFGMARFFRPSDAVNLERERLPDQVCEVEAISGACMLVRREAMLEVGPLDEGYFMHAEDLDWCLRFRSRGWRILFVPDARVVHSKGVSSRSRPFFVEWQKHRSMLRYYRKHIFSVTFPGILLVIPVVGGICMHLLIALIRAAMSRGSRAG